ncbi:hypothetical protein DL96DRAFT_1043143 [Flagelloscypha sp. PMI_526]|nr:hypothetical protein DL96DRAFT_1043143 [Flagelloscypha sp. PMI_526]
MSLQPLSPSSPGILTPMQAKPPFPKGPIVQGWKTPKCQDKSHSLLPHNSILHRVFESARSRTQHACDKCRARKAKCSGEHPVCGRCHERGLDCEYSKHPRVRGPNKSHRDFSKSTNQLRSSDSVTALAPLGDKAPPTVNLSFGCTTLESRRHSSPHILHPSSGSVSPPVRPLLLHLLTPENDKHPFEHNPRRMSWTAMNSYRPPQIAFHRHSSLQHDTLSQLTHTSQFSDMTVFTTCGSITSVGPQENKAIRTCPPLSIVTAGLSSLPCSESSADRFADYSLDNATPPANSGPSSTTSASFPSDLFSLPSSWRSPLTTPLDSAGSSADDFSTYQFPPPNRKSEIQVPDQDTELWVKYQGALEGGDRPQQLLDVAQSHSCIF